MKKEKSCAYICHSTLIDMYNQFEHKNSLSFSSFYKYIDNRFKKPFTMSDLCSLCEKNRVSLFIEFFYEIYNILFFYKFKRFIKGKSLIMLYQEDIMKL